MLGSLPYIQALFWILASGSNGSAGNAITVPLEVLRTRHIVVQTKINGKGPYRLVLDTGAPITFVNRRLATELGLMKPEEDQRPMGVAMGGQVKVKSLEVGDAMAEDVPVIILDHPIVEMIGQVEGGGIHGIVGYTFWSRYKMTLDYQKKTVTFVQTSYQPNDVLGSLYSRLMRSDGRPPVVSSAGIWGMVVETKGKRVFVKSVTPGWPAHAGGLRTGDLIETIERRWVDSEVDLLDALARASTGRPAEVLVRRKGKRLLIKVIPVPGA